MGASRLEAMKGAVAWGLYKTWCLPYLRPADVGQFHELRKAVQALYGYKSAHLSSI